MQADGREDERDEDEKRQKDTQEMRGEETVEALCSRAKVGKTVLREMLNILTSGRENTSCN